MIDDSISLRPVFHGNFQQASHSQQAGSPPKVHCHLPRWMTARSVKQAVYPLRSGGLRYRASRFLSTHAGGEASCSRVFGSSLHRIQ